MIILVETNDFCRFGGFTKIGFTSNGETKNDDSSFLFSFDKMKIYKIKKKCKAIYCDADYGPCFGGKENKGFWISNNYSKEKSYVGKANGFYLNMTQDYELNKGIQEFTINKLEIFKIF